MALQFVKGILIGFYDIAQGQMIKCTKGVYMCGKHGISAFQAERCLSTRAPVSESVWCLHRWMQAKE